MGKTMSGSLPEVTLRFRQAVAEAKWSEVLILASELWSMNDQSIKTYLLASKAALSLSDREQAELWLDRGFHQCAPNWQLYRAMGDIKRVSGQFKDALNWYKKAVIEAPEEAKSYARLGAVQLRLRQYEDAANNLRCAIRIAGPEASLTWLSQVGTADYKLGRFLEARDSFMRVNKERPEPRFNWMIAEIDRRIKRTDDQSSDVSAGFYDDVFSERSEYHVSWQQSGYSSVWRRIIYLLKDTGITSILDLGCGPGQFADCVADLLPSVNYHGVDFSEVAIAHAKIRQPDFTFTQCVLPVASYNELGDFDAVVCTEVLEHVNSDVSILEPLPAGMFVVFSVPNFDSFGHVRVFDSGCEVSDRYGAMFDTLEIESFHHTQNNIFWIGIGRIKGRL